MGLIFYCVLSGGEVNARIYVFVVGVPLSYTPSPLPLLSTLDYQTHKHNKNAPLPPCSLHPSSNPSRMRLLPFSLPSAHSCMMAQAGRCGLTQFPWDSWKTNVEKRNISKGTSTIAGFDVEVEHWRRSRIENRCGEDLSRKRHGERKGRTEKSWQTFSLSPSTSFLSFWEALYAFSPPSPFCVLYFFFTLSPPHNRVCAPCTIIAIFWSRGWKRHWHGSSLLHCLNSHILHGVFLVWMEWHPHDFMYTVKEEKDILFMQAHGGNIILFSNSAYVLVGRI